VRNLKGETGRTISEKQFRDLEWRGAEKSIATDELDELKNVKNELVEKEYSDAGNNGCVDPGHEVLKVLADAAELQFGESREDNTCQWRWTSSIRARRWGLEFDRKGLEPGQSRQAYGHRFRWKVSCVWYVLEFNTDEDIGRPKKLW
jgi:hypothetical protein